MPKGSPTPQTKATEKYKKKAGIKGKKFDLREDFIEEWEQACKKAGVTQTAKIKELMQQFIYEVNEKHSE